MVPARSLKRPRPPGSPSLVPKTIFIVYKLAQYIRSIDQGNICMDNRSFMGGQATPGPGPPWPVSGHHGDPGPQAGAEAKGNSRQCRARQDGQPDMRPVNMRPHMEGRTCMSENRGPARRPGQAQAAIQSRPRLAPGIESEASGPAVSCRLKADGDKKISFFDIYQSE